LDSATETSALKTVQNWGIDEQEAGRLRRQQRGAEMVFSFSRGGRN
jgi:hypothetical protein